MTYPIAQSLYPPHSTVRRDTAPRRWVIACHDLWTAWRRRADERRQILRFTERELRDAGLTSGDVYRELAIPFWKTKAPAGKSAD